MTEHLPGVGADTVYGKDGQEEQVVLRQAHFRLAEKAMQYN